MIHCTKRVICYSIRRINNKQKFKQHIFSGTELMPYILDIEYKRQIPFYPSRYIGGFGVNLSFVQFFNLWFDTPKYNYFQSKLFKTEEEAKEFGQTLRKGECQECGETNNCIYVNHF